MTGVRTHYVNLQVLETASPEVIRGAYRHLAQRWHPDKNPENLELAIKNTQIISVAYAVLSDPVQRREHDEWIADQRNEAAERAAAEATAKVRTKYSPNEVARKPTVEYPHHIKSEFLRASNDISLSKGPSLPAKIGAAIVLLISSALLFKGVQDFTDPNFKWVTLGVAGIWLFFAGQSFVLLFRPQFVSKAAYDAVTRQTSFIYPFIAGAALFVIVGMAAILLYRWVVNGL